jgi:hypothetical protein
MGSIRGMCLKIAYVSRADANRAAAAAPKQRVYHCEHCGLWHLSSKSKRQVKQNRKRG